MAEEVEMTPVEASEPPKVDLSAQPAAGRKTLKLAVPQIKKPGSITQSALRPGLKLPPKPGMATGLKLPPKPGMATGLKLPPKPGIAAGLKLPSAPVIRKPGATVTATLPKPMTLNPVAPADTVAGAAKPAAPAPAAAKPVVPVDAQGVGRLSTVKMEAVPRSEAFSPVAPQETVKPLDALKSATQKLKGITQPIPQQAILRKTGIIADAAMSVEQKEAAKHKTARISLSDAMGVAPVNNENAPMKTIRIKRPLDIPGASDRISAPNPPADGAPKAAETDSPSATPADPAARTSPSFAMTQRKTLKIARPGTAVRPSGRFTTKRPATAAAKKPPAADTSSETEIADIPDMPASSAPVSPFPTAAPAAETQGGWIFSLSSFIQLSACAVIGVLAWYLYQNTQTQYF